MTPLLTSGDMPNLRAALEGYAVALRNAYQDNLIRSDRIATGGLLNSINARVESSDGSWDVIFNLAEWWKWVEDDTKPHWPPRSALLKWIQAKPVIPRPDRKGRVPSPESLAFLIGRRIAGKAPDGNGGFKPGGTEGSHDLERAEQEILGKWIPRIAAALQQDLTEGMRYYILESFREINIPPIEM